MAIDRKFDGNPSYSPEKCGLETVAFIDWDDEAYQFKQTYVWRDLESGDLYMASDSGCSCPSPFEDYKSLADLERLESMEQIDPLVNAWKRRKGEHRSGTSPANVESFVNDVKQALAR